MKSGSLQVQIEKRTRNVFELDEVYKASCFKPHLKRIRWQKPVKSLCVSFAAAQDSLCYNFSFRDRRKWPQACRICRVLGLGRDRISLHRIEGFSHLGAPGGLEGLPGGPIGFHETIGTLLRAFEVALRGYPGSKIRLSFALLGA